MAIKKRTKIIRKSKKVQKKRREPRRSLRQWFFILCALSFLACVGYVGLCSSLTLIEQIEVTGVRRVQSEEIISRVEGALSGTIFGCIKKNNFFFLNTRNIIDEIKKDQRVKSISVKKHFPHQIIISIEEYETVPIWCVKSISGKCYELQGGCVYRKIEIDSDIVQKNQHYIVLDHGNETLSANQCVISTEELHKIQSLGKELVYTLNVGIEQPFVINFRGSQEVAYTTDEKWTVLVDLTREISETLDIASLFVKKVQLPTRRSDLEYVDLRFPERIFFKLKDGIEIEKSSSDLNEEDSQEEKND